MQTVAHMWILLWCALTSAVNSAAPDQSKHAEAKRSANTQPIMDEAALQEAAIHHASLSTEKPHPQAQAAYLETSPQHQLEKSKHAVKGLEEAVGASENNDEDDDDDEDDEDDGKQSHRRLRASKTERKGIKNPKVSTQAKVDHQVKDDHQELFDPVAWA